MKHFRNTMFLTIALFCLNITAYAQNVALKMNNVTVKQAINELKAKTGYSFFFESGDLNTKKIIDVNANSLNTAIDQIISGQEVTYTLRDKEIIVKKSSPKTNQTQRNNGHKVTGTVKDSKGEPIIGASILIKGTSSGTITDIDGHFNLDNINDNNDLIISYIGYTTQNVKVGERTTLNIQMHENDKTLDEVVVIGYGTVKRRDLTGSVASVSGDKLAANPVANVQQALQGLLPGVAVTSQDGRPGADVSIKIRGGGSITQSNSPLYVVDGLVGSIDNIPADNIESIDVLKDAASTAIYGARGANGVILITTKGAKDGKLSVHYNTYYQIKKNPKTLEVLDAYDYVLWNWSYATAYGDSYGDGVAKYFGLGSNYGNHLNEYKNVASHNYINDVMRTASTWNHDLSISGGNDMTKIYATINYTDDQGIRIQSDYSRWNADFKLIQKITNRLSFDADLRYNESKVEGANFSYATSVYSFRPIDNPLGDATYSTGLGQGEPNVDMTYNPVSLIDNAQNIDKSQHIRAKGGLTWNVIKGLTAKSELVLSREWGETRGWDAGLQSGYKLAKLTESHDYGVRWANTLNYEIQGLSENKVSFLLGNEVEASKSNSTVIQGAGYPSGFSMEDAFGMISMTNVAKDYGKNLYSNTIGTPRHTLSWFGRANYSYKGRYLLTGTFRADGSSKFAPNHHWGYFPAGAAAWRISDEPFMQNTRNWLDNLKLRVSYGTSGADNIDPSLWKEIWVTKQITVDGVAKTIYVPGDMLGNDNLKWETTISRNTGLDFGFLNGKVHGSLDLYWNTTKNTLMKVPVDASAGYSYQFQNIGQTSNKGIELALALELIHTKDINLSISASYGYNKNNVDKISKNALVDTGTGWSSLRKPTYDYVVREGQPVGLIQGYKSAGFYTVNDFDYDKATGTYTLKNGVADIQGIVNYPNGIIKGFKVAAGQTAFPGSAKFEDIDGNGIVNDDDVTIIGKAQAQHSGGFNINASYKSIDFSAGFAYQIGGAIYNTNAMISMRGDKDSSLGTNRLSFTKDTYKVYDVDANGNLFLVTDPDALNALNTNAKYALNYSEYGIVSSEFIEDASYLRLQTLTLGYTLPKSLTNRIGVKNCRIYFTGSNLFCITGYSGLDPDVNMKPSVNGFPTPNYDYNAYPKARTYTFGLNLTF